MANKRSAACMPFLSIFLFPCGHLAMSSTQSGLRLEAKYQTINPDCPILSVPFAFAITNTNHRGQTKGTSTFCLGQLFN